MLGLCRGREHNDAEHYISVTDDVYLVLFCLYIIWSFCPLHRRIVCYCIDIVLGLQTICYQCHTSHIT